MVLFFSSLLHILVIIDFCHSPFFHRRIKYKEGHKYIQTLHTTINSIDIDDVILYKLFHSETCLN